MLRRTVAALAAAMCLALLVACGVTWDQGSGKIESVEKITWTDGDAYVLKIEGFDEKFLVTKTWIKNIPSMKAGDRATFTWSPPRPKEDGGYTLIQSLTVLMAVPTVPPPKPPN